MAFEHGGFRREQTFWLEGLGPRHLRYQKRIFEFLFLPVIGDIAWKIADISTHFSWMQLWLTLVYGLMFWIVGATITAALFYVACWSYDFDLHLYYRVWLPHIKPIFAELSVRERDIVASFSYFMPGDSQWEGKRPCFIEREDLMRKSFWHGWLFSIVTLFGDEAVKQDVVADRNIRKLWTLQVSLMSEGYGIYNNQGKKFLHERFLKGNEEVGSEVIKRSKAFVEMTKPSQRVGATWRWNEFGSRLPIRWASGGILPLIWYDNDYWVLLFFRDRPPVGLNVPNGASESKDEYKNLWHLMNREFNEEVVVLSGRPSRGVDLLQRQLLGQFQNEQFLTPEFAEEHARLRNLADGFTVSSDSNEARHVEFLRTPYAVKVEFHARDLGGTRTTETRDVIYSLNPAEFGIEVMALATFDLLPGEYIIDGEYDLGRKVLIRRPPIMLRLGYLAEIFKDNQGSLGTRIESGVSADGKLMAELSHENCIVFDADVDLRRVRRNAIKQQLGKERSVARRGALIWEKDKIVDGWLATYEGAFSRVRDTGLSGNGEADRQLRTLCPVTWKTLELAFAQRVFGELRPRRAAMGSGT